MENYAHMQFLSYAQNDKFARDVAASFIAPAKLDNDRVSDIQTVISEAITNCVDHAYPQEAGKISMRLELSDAWLRIVIRDYGVGIANIERAREPLFTTGGDKHSGMGLTIMESFTDTMRVWSQPGKGTRITMRFRMK